MEIHVTPNISLPRKIRREVKHAIGRIAGYELNPETGRTYSEERMIRRMEKKAGAGFLVLPTPETTLKDYERPESD